MENIPVLGYWKIRGLAQPIRLLLEYLQVKYSENLYEQGEGPDFSRDEWFSKKYSLGMDFPNLPYYFDGDVRFSESNAILRYIVNKYNKELQGKTDSDFAIVEQLVGVLSDIKSTISYHCYQTGDRQKLKDFFYSEIEKVLSFLGNKTYLVGDYLTYVDFILYEMNELMAHISGNEVFEKFPKLKEYNLRIESISSVSEYLASLKKLDMPFNNKVAKI